MLIQRFAKLFFGCLAAVTSGMMYAVYLSTYHERKFWFSSRQVKKKLNYWNKSQIVSLKSKLIRASLELRAVPNCVLEIKADPCQLGTARFRNPVPFYSGLCLWNSSLKAGGSPTYSSSVWSCFYLIFLVILISCNNFSKIWRKRNMHWDKLCLV